MATRANIEIYFADRDDTAKYKKIVTLYRHWDGYPSGLGFDIHKNLVNQVRGDRDILHLLCKDENIQLTTGLHGDIEYIYKIYCGRMGHANDWSNVRLDMVDANDGALLHRIEYGTKDGKPHYEYVMYAEDEELKDALLKSKNE